MQSISTLPENDPVSRHVAERTRRHPPVPLIAASYDIEVRGGLADVCTRRRFRNVEADTIEATLTVPIPVHAVLYELEARIGERLLKASARARDDARTAYEDALERGKTTVLHEELLRGVHLLSVGHIPPQTDIEVSARFSIALTAIDGRRVLTIPTTVGDVYGFSGLPDSDDLAHAPSTLHAAVSVRTDKGRARLIGASLGDECADVSLNAPIAIEIDGWETQPIFATASDGRCIELTIEPAVRGEADIDAAILVDRSGSMGERCGRDTAISKFEAVLLGLSEAAGDLRDTDRLNLWDFNTEARDLGVARARTWRNVIRDLQRPEGGTEIGTAIAAVLQQRKVGDIVLVTDGKSHALDVHALARSGPRFTVVLIGEDSLEANVGHLSSLTAGEVFIPADADIGAAVKSALRSLRDPVVRREETGARPSAFRCRRGGMEIGARWRESGTPAVGNEGARAAAAFAAGLALPQLSTDDARKLALEEGLVTHLTSLVLVDEAGKAQIGVPTTRKVPLASPHTGFAPSPGSRARRVECFAQDVRASVSHGRQRSVVVARAPHSSPPPLSSDVEVRRSIVSRPAVASPQSPASPPQPVVLSQLAFLSNRIDWKEQGAELARENMVGVDHDVADAVDEAARHAHVRDAARRLGLSPRALVIALLAQRASAHDRFADRVFRALVVKDNRRQTARLAMELLVGPRPGSRESSKRA